MIYTLHRLLWKAANDWRELPEATENRSQVQVSQRGRVRRNSRLENQSGPMRTLSVIYKT